MTGPLKIALTSLLVTLYVMAQAFCACAVVLEAARDMPAPIDMMTEMTHHDHQAMLDMSNDEAPPCEHCERGVDKATLTLSSVAIFNPVFEIQPLSSAKAPLFTDKLVFPANKALERRAWLDPPPPIRAATPISLKTRLLT